MNCLNSGFSHFGLREGAPAGPAPTTAGPSRCSSPKPPDNEGSERFSTLATMERTEKGWGDFGGAKGEAGGGGLLGTGLLKGLFGAHSPVLDAIHSVVDDIPIVGDIAKKVCSVVSPDYHRAAEQKEQCPKPQELCPKPQPQLPQQPQLNIALAYSQSNGVA